MSNTYGSIKEFVFGEHNEAFSQVLGVFHDFGLRFFLIGAQARDVHFFQQGIKPVRGTRDIDFAVMVETMDQYKMLMEALVSRGFEETKDPFRLNWKVGETVIDLLPFGQIEEAYTVNFNERKLEISVLGYREVNEEVIEVLLDQEATASIPVAPLHGLFLLKLVSWDDKKPGREKDLRDMNQILVNYWYFIEEEAFEHHLDLFEGDFETDKAAARILGRHLRRILNKSQVLKERIQRVLSEQSAALEPPGLMLQKFASERGRPLEEIKALIDEILLGINEY